VCEYTRKHGCELRDHACDTAPISRSKLVSSAARAADRTFPHGDARRRVAAAGAARSAEIGLVGAMNRRDGAREPSDEHRVGIRHVAALALLALAVVVVVGTVTPGEAGAAAGIAIGGLIVASLRPGDVRDLIRRLKRLKVAGSEVELGDLEEDAKKAAQQTPASEEASGARTLVELQLLLEAKLAYVAKILLAEPDAGASDESVYRPSFATIGSLEYDKYLEKEQARTAHRLLTMSEPEFAALPEETKQDFLADARVLVRNFRAAVFHGMVRKALGKRTVAPRAIGTLHAICVEADGIQITIVPVFDAGGSTTKVADVHRELPSDWLRRGDVLFVVPNQPHTRLTGDERPPVVPVRDVDARITQVARDVARAHAGAQSG
jgi:hypothetical protein